MQYLKEQAKMKENVRMKRLAAIQIQKVTRGFLVRLHMRKKQQTEFKCMRKLRRLLSVAYGRKRSKIVQSVVMILKQCSDQVEREQQEMYEKYMNHCATMI
jgi:hypothetical protein